MKQKQDVTTKKQSGKRDLNSRPAVLDGRQAIASNEKLGGYDSAGAVVGRHQSPQCSSAVNAFPLYLGRALDRQEVRR